MATIQDVAVRDLINEAARCFGMAASIGNDVTRHEKAVQQVNAQLDYRRVWIAHHDTLCNLEALLAELPATKKDSPAGFEQIAPVVRRARQAVAFILKQLATSSPRYGEFVCRLRTVSIEGGKAVRLTQPPVPCDDPPILTTETQSLAEVRRWAVDALAEARECEKGVVRKLAGRLKVHARWLSGDTLSRAVALDDRDRLGLIQLLEMVSENADVPGDKSKNIPTSPPSDPEDQRCMDRLSANRIKPENERLSDADVMRELAPDDKAKQDSIKTMWTRYKAYYLPEYR